MTNTPFRDVALDVPLVATAPLSCPHAHSWLSHVCTPSQGGGAVYTLGSSQILVAIVSMIVRDCFALVSELFCIIASIGREVEAGGEMVKGGYGRSHL